MNLNTEIMKDFTLLAVLSTLLVLVTLGGLKAQQTNDTLACLTRFEKGGVNSFKIPMTKFCYVNDAERDKNGSFGWIMKWDVVKNVKTDLLFLEMNSTDVEGWRGSKNISGSVQLVLEIPKFIDSIVFSNLANIPYGLYAINNYGGISTAKEFVRGNLKIFKSSGL